MTSIRFLLVALLALAFGLATGCGGEEPAAEPAPTEAPPPAEPAPPTEPAPTSPAEPEPPPVTEPEPASEETTVLAVYFLRGETVDVVRREVEKTQAVGTAALEELIAGPTPEEESTGLHSELPDGTSLNGLVVDAGIATVDLSAEFASGGGSLSMFTRLAQVVYTLTQFPTVDGVVFELDGEPVETFSSEGIILEGPQTREDYEGQTPAILVETPLAGDSVSSPLMVAGTANVFEANVQYELLDSTGAVLAGGFTTATCGTGCRGTFEITVPFDGSGESSGTLVVFESSAKDGSRINVVERPLAFE